MYELSDDLAAEKTQLGIDVFPYFRDARGKSHRDMNAPSITLAKWDLVSLAVKYLELHRLLDETVGLYLEFRNVHGYEEHAAKTAAVNEVLEGLDALEDVARLESEQQDGDVKGENDEMGKGPTVREFPH